jgi:YVTN family beta-propeller protein
MTQKILKLAVCLGCAVCFWAVTPEARRDAVVSAQTQAPGPTTSSPIALSPDDRFVWVANPDSNSVSVVRVENDANQLVAEIPVGTEPQNVAISPNGATVYVSNTVSGTVTVIDAASRQIISTILVGTEPYGMALTPNGRKLYVANARSNNVTVIDGTSNTLLTTIQNVGPEPRGIAITSDGDSDDLDEKVYVTQFLASDRPGTIIGADNYKEGRVTVIGTGTDTILRQVILNPIADTGFRSNGSALQRIPATNPATFTVVTGAFPNNLNSIVIKGNRAYLPNNGASPDGPVRFNVNVQALLSVLDTVTDEEGQAGGASQTINMNRGINFEPQTENRLFLGVPWQIAFEHQSNEGWVVASTANIIVKVVLDASGTPTINAPLAAGGASNVIRIKVGQNPRGIAINKTDTRAYVMNEVSRNISVVNLLSNAELTRVRTAALPLAGTNEATVLLGKAIFNSGAAVDLPELGSVGVIPSNRLSSEGWSSCFACHAFGQTDGVVWIFGAGPRRSLPLSATFNPHNPNDQKVLNYSAIFDEVQDFENNIRGTSGGLGLITLADGSPDPVLDAFNPPNTGRSVQLDALAAYVAQGIRSPISPFKNPALSSRDRRLVTLGRQLFSQAGCAICHGGEGWSSNRRDYPLPPGGPDNPIVAGQLTRFLRDVGTFDPTAVNEIRQNGAPPLGALGFNAPSLLGSFALFPLLHNGSAFSFEDILANTAHRRAGQLSGTPDPLNSAANREALIAFLKTIDDSTKQFKPGE